MNEKQIESLLRKAPVPVAPEGLRQNLLEDLRLPRVVSDSSAPGQVQSWLKRWLPAVSFAAFFLTCLVVLGIQSLNLREMNQQNEALKARVQESAATKTVELSDERVRLAQAELERLRADDAEAAKLRKEVADLQTQLPDITQLRQENQRLRVAQLTAAGPGAQPNDDLFAKAERIRCVNNLKQIGLAGRVWANDYNEQYPPDFLSMTNELSTPKVLQCPSDKAHSVTDWLTVANGQTSYEMLSPGLDMKVEHNPSIVFAVCRLHNNICLADGSVQQLTPERMQNSLKQVDGRTVFAP